MGNIVSKRWIIICIVIWLLTGTYGFCSYFPGDTKNWSVPMFGVFKVPKEFRAAEFKSLKELVDVQKDKILENQATLNIPSGKKNALDPNSIDFAVFQLSMNDGNSYHLAWLVAIKDKRPIPVNEDYFSKPVNIEQKVQAILMHDSINKNIDQLEFNDPKTGAGVKVLEVPPFEFMTVNNKQAYSGGVRLLITYQDFIFPLYGKAYVFNSHNHASAMVLITLDSEREFWASILNNVIPTLQAGKK